MRFKITARVEKTVYGNKLPINYSYPLTSWIYHVLAKADSAYAEWLHENAFKDGNKVFKFFTFSNLNIPKLKLDKDRLLIFSDTVSFYLSFLPEKSTETFIKGLFQDQQFTLGDKYSKVQFGIQQIELMPFPDLAKVETFKTLSPVVVSVKEKNGKVTYLGPEREEYSACLFKNLKEKYKTYYGREFSGSEEFAFELLSPAKPRLITIKAGTPNETKVKGYNYIFNLKADEELVRLAYEAGLAEKGSQGFGMIEVNNHV